MKDELSGKILIKVVGLTAKTYSYLIDEGSEDKKAKDTRMCVIKRKLKFEINKSCLEAIQRDNEIEYLEKNKFNVDSLKRNHKEFVKNKLILQTQKRFKSESHNVFTEEINKIALKKKSLNETI